ncbi:MAG TPA: hypothetical protein IAC70_00330 [Candidatus Faecicola pullistercoris]|nr:hypothetical protein [Candidatus Faecicola pullistercoris]
MAQCDCLMKLILQKKIEVILACQGNLLDCSERDIPGIIVCSKWQSSPT